MPAGSERVFGPTEAAARRMVRQMVVALPEMNLETPPENPAFGCQWQSPRCREESTHWHPMFGELCPTHAAKVMTAMPGKVVRLADTLKTIAE
jgi:hypothetical protein